VGVLLALLRRFRVGVVLTIAAVVDIAVVAIAGLSTRYGDASSVGFLMGVMELMLLLSALTLPRRQAAVLGLFCTLWQIFLGVYLGIPGDKVAAMGIVTAAFSVAVTWAGSRMGDLATRHVLGDYFSQLIRQHRDALARANVEIAAQRDQVLAAQAEAETMARLMVHDLKNPLAALQQFVALAGSRLERAAAAGRDGPELALAREDLELAGAEGERLTEMVGDLLLISRLEHASLTPDLRDTSVPELLAGVARGARARAEERHVKVTVASPERLAAPIDREMVRRLLENLVANALRFVERGGRVELAAAMDGDALALSVRNTGPAVAEQARPFLFQLGLYLCRLVAEAHGGTIALLEAPEWPVAFQARLPLPAPAQAAQAG